MEVRTINFCRKLDFWEEEYNFLEGEYNQYQGRQEECRSDQQNAKLLLSPEILDLRFCE